MPKIFSKVRKFDFDEDVVRKNCEPYLLSPEGRFRYTLALNQYEGMPNNSIIRFWVETSEGTQESSDLYLRYGNTPSWLRSYESPAARFLRWYAATLSLLPQMFMLHHLRDPFLLMSKK